MSFTRGKEGSPETTPGMGGRRHEKEGALTAKSSALHEVVLAYRGDMVLLELRQRASSV